MIKDGVYQTALARPIVRAAAGATILKFGLRHVRNEAPD